MLLHRSYKEENADKTNHSGEYMTKSSKNVKLFSVFILLVILFSVVYFIYGCVTASFMRPTSESAITGGSCTEVITEKSDIKQYFIPDCDTDGIGLRFATYGIRAWGRYILEVYNTDDSLVANAEIRGSRLRNNQYCDIGLSDSLKAGTPYYFKIYAKNRKNDKAAIWKGKSDEEAYKNELYINGSLTDESLIFRTASRSCAKPAAILGFDILFCGLCFLMFFGDRINKRYVGVAVAAIYIVFAVVFAAKGAYYIKNWERTPDERQHIAYAIDINLDGYPLVPDYKSLKSYKSTGDWNSLGETKFVREDTASYLGHPLPYYGLMSLLGGVREEGGEVFVNLLRLKLFNLFLVLVGVALMFYIGFTRIKRDGGSFSYHILYAAICTAVPMMAGVACGVSNDNILYIWFSLFFLGLIRYYEGKKNFVTYALAAVSITGAAMTKLTAAEILVLAAAVFVAVEIIKERSLKVLLNKSFLASLIIYAPGILYYICIYMKYNTVLPTLKVFSPEEFYRSSFYIKEELRVYHSLSEFVEIFRRLLVQTWTGLYNGTVSLFKTKHTPENCVFMLILYLFAAAFVLSSVKTLIGKEKGRDRIIIALGAALILTVLTNFYVSYSSYLSDGRVGNVQARYFLCIVPFLAMCCLSIFNGAKRVLERIGLPRAGIAADIGCVLFALLLIYYDFPYFYFLHFISL